MDQVVLAGPNDLDVLPIHIMADHINNKFLDKTYYIIPERCLNSEIIQNLLNDLGESILENIEFISENDLLSPSVCLNPWIYQQLLKLSVDKLRETHSLSESFLFTDVDSICLRPIEQSDFQHNGKFIFFCGSDNPKPILADNFEPALIKSEPEMTGNYDWFYAMTWSTFQLLGIENPPRLTAIDACTIWNQRILRQLKRRLSKRFDCCSWYEAIIREYVNFIYTFKANFKLESEFRKIAFSLFKKKNRS